MDRGYIHPALLPPGIQLACLPLVEAVRCLAGPPAPLPSSHAHSVGWEGVPSPGVPRRTGTAGSVGELALVHQLACHLIRMRALLCFLLYDSCSHIALLVSPDLQLAARMVLGCCSYSHDSRSLTCTAVQQAN